jgi:cytoskeletal protein CcmA (bactofilin family)
MSGRHRTRPITIPRLPGAVRLFLLMLGVVIAAVTIRNRSLNSHVPPPQPDHVMESAAFHIARHALGRSVDALSDNPGWRDGYRQAVHEDGVFDVNIYDGADNGEGIHDPSVPRGCVRIVATGTSGDDTVSVEGFWSNVTDPFTHVLLSGNSIRVVGQADGNCVIIGDVFNNAREDGSTVINVGTTLYGNVTSPGRVVLGGSGSPSAATVYGRMWADDIEIENNGEILDFEDVNESEAGFDLDFDGVTDNLFVSKSQGTLSASRSALSDGISLSEGNTDFRVSRGASSVHIGNPGPGVIVRPLPDFAAYFELTTGSNAYRPETRHLTTSISGDGDGHYFHSAEAFIEWIHRCYPIPGACWRCAGDGRIGPDEATHCPGCLGTGRQAAIEIVGVFYIDDDILDLSEVGANLIVHGTIVVAAGNPREWPSRATGGSMTARRYPTRGALVIKGPTRMHFTQTYRSTSEGESYLRYRRPVGSHRDGQMLPFPGTGIGTPLREFPGLLCASTIEIAPRGVGFACHRGDIGDETMTILQGVVFAGDHVHLDARGGWDGDPIVFDEELPRADDDSFEEPVLNIDLNGDGDLLDSVETIDITTCPLVPVSGGRSNVDINNDGVLGQVIIGTRYRDFFVDNGYRLPVLFYHEGVILSDTIEVIGSCVITFDPHIPNAGMPFGFEHDSAISPNGLVTWRTLPRR